MSNNTFEEQEQENEVYVDNEKTTDKKDIRERLEDFSDRRLVSGRISELSSRATFLVSDDVLSKLSDLVDHMEAISALDSTLNENKTVKEIRDMRLFSKGFKSKFVGYALESALAEWEAEKGLIPETKRVRYKAQDGTYHRTFKFKEEGVLYLITQSNRGNELEFLTSEDVSESEIESKFSYYEELAESQSKK